MGLYAEPPGDKLAWIEQFPRINPTSFELDGSGLPVVCLQTGFVALGVAYSMRELKRFLQGRPDGRWYLVPKAELRQVVPGGAKMKELR